MKLQDIVKKGLHDAKQSEKNIDWKQRSLNALKLTQEATKYACKKGNKITKITADTIQPYVNSTVPITLGMLYAYGVGEIGSDTIKGLSELNGFWQSTVEISKTAGLAVGLAIGEGYIFKNFPIKKDKVKTPSFFRRAKTLATATALSATMLLTANGIKGTIENIIFDGKETPDYVSDETIKPNGTIIIYNPKQEENNYSLLTAKGDTITVSPRSENILKYKDVKEYINLKTLTFNLETAQMTREIFEPFTLKEIMKLTGLKGLYADYLIYNKEFNPEAAFAEMWYKKKNLMYKLSKNKFHDFADQTVKDYSLERSTKGSLEEFKGKIGRTLEDITADFNFDKYFKNMEAKFNYEKIPQQFEDKKKAYMLLFNSIDANTTLAAFSTTELFGNINPAFNLIFYDKMLGELGYQYCDKIPALGDKYLSFGEFQNTAMTIRGREPGSATSLNEYIMHKKNRAPESMVNYDNTTEHIQGTILNIMNNIELFVNTLENYQGNKKGFDSHLNEFNNLFSELNQRERRIFVAGILSAAHNGSSPTRNAILEYTIQYSKGKKDAKDIIQDIKLPDKIKTYYDKSLINYIILDSWQH